MLHEDGRRPLHLPRRHRTSARPRPSSSKTKEFLERVIDSSVDAIVAADLQRHASSSSTAPPSASTATSAEDVVGKMNVASLYPRASRREVMRLIQLRDVRRHGPARRTTGCDMLGKDGERDPGARSRRRSSIENGKPDRRRSASSPTCASDCGWRSAWPQAQEELRAREKQAIIAELAGAAAHELNQPLTSVMGYAELLSGRLEPRHARRTRRPHVIVNEAERMAEIVRKIGKITKYETKTYVGAAKILDLDKASEETQPAGPRRTDEASMKRRVRISSAGPSPGPSSGAAARAPARSSPPSRARPRPNRDRVVGEIPAAWLARLLAVSCELPIEEGPDAVATALVEAVAAILPEPRLRPVF